MSHEKTIPVTLLLTINEINKLLILTKESCKIKEKGSACYCEKMKCLKDFNKIENGFVRAKFHSTHNCLKLNEAKKQIDSIEGDVDSE